jgi:hypothetical protein
VRYRYRYAVEQPQGDEALFFIPEAVILERERRTIKHLLRIDEVDVEVLEVLQPLSLVPTRTASTECIYTGARVQRCVLLPENAAVQRPPVKRGASAE